MVQVLADAAVAISVCAAAFVVVTWRSLAAMILRDRGAWLDSEADIQRQLKELATDVQQLRRLEFERQRRRVGE